MRILLVDDDEALMEALATCLKDQRYAIDIATDGSMAWEFILLFDYDLVLLDWMIPEIDGISLCRRLRAEGYKMPIILVTARDGSSDKVMGLDSGADDYVVKPFDFAELTARIRALLRRDSQTASPVLQWDGLSLNPKTCETKYHDRVLPLTPKEYGLLELFLRHQERVFSPGAIIEHLWSGEDPPGEESVRTHIKGLRQKLKAVGVAKDTIQTVYGIGYRLKALKSNDNQRSAAVKREYYFHKLAQVRSSFQAISQERLLILENFAAALVQERHSDELQIVAKNTAHKLAGSLGSFGCPEGSKIAKKLEELLYLGHHTLLERAPEITALVDRLHNELQSENFSHTSIEQSNRLLFLAIDNYNHSDFTKRLAKEAAIWSMNASILLWQDTPEAVIPTRENIESILHREFPAVLLIKISFPQAAGLELLSQLREHSQIPIVVLMSGGTFDDRVQVVRQGASLILQEPIDPDLVLASISDLLKGSGSDAKIVIVDDDPQILLTLKLALEPWGFQLTTVDQPREFWQVLERVNPDLVVLDVEMPDINGIELCQLLRSDRRWQHLPVLFLTVRQDEKTQHQAFANGADDYISKPVVGNELANRILNRLQRSRLDRT
jgi:DNA-binding response OmpR family regulator/HPt (histidine-containing phosphotransfer) domain-containing protein